MMKILSLLYITSSLLKIGLYSLTATDELTDNKRTDLPLQLLGGGVLSKRNLNLLARVIN